MENKIHRTSHYCDDVAHIYVFWQPVNSLSVWGKIARKGKGKAGGGGKSP